jgi:Flp pilus assembly protein TadB
MQFIEQVQEFFGSIPKPVLFAVVILVLVGGYFLWKKMTSKDSEDNMTPVLTHMQEEREPLMAAVTQDYIKEVQTGLEDLEEDTKDELVPVGAEDEE